MKVFLKYIAYLQIIGIIFVVIGHSFHEYPDGALGETHLLHRMIYSFHMPLFLFVSGFLMVYTTQIRKGHHKSIGAFVTGKMKRLLLPFFFLSSLVFIPRALMSGIADNPIDLSVKSFIDSFLYFDSLVIPFFWFLQTSFILLCVCYAFITLSQKAGIDDFYSYLTIFLLFLGLSIFGEPLKTDFLSLFKTIDFGMYFAAGAFYCRYAERIEKKMRWDSPILFIVLAAIWTGLFFLTEGTHWIAVCSFFGIAMCYSAARILEAKQITVLDHLAGTTYAIFLLSWFFNIGSQQVLSHFVTWPWWGYTIISILTGIYCPWLIYKYLESHQSSPFWRTTAFLLGQNFKRPERLSVEPERG